MALTTKRQIGLIELLTGLEYSQACLGRTATRICTGWLNHVPLEPEQFIPVHNGIGIVLHVRSRPPPIPGRLSTGPEADETGFFQVDGCIGERLTHGQVAHTHSPTHVLLSVMLWAYQMRTQVIVNVLLLIQSSSSAF